MKFSDIIELAKQGYKPNDIKELLELETEPKAPEPPETEPEQEPEPEEEPKEPEPDYKKLYEESQAKLAKAQKENREKDVSKDDKTDEEIFSDFVKKFI